MLDLATMSIEQRRKLSGLNPKRADIIVAGLLVIERILRRLKVNTLQVHTRGVRDGLLLTMIQRASPRVTTREERRAAAERLARSCGVDLPHARQVGRLARMLLDQLSGPLGLDPADGELIETAALLSNIGYLINFEKHHKHSYHLILNSELIGFDRRELLLLAVLARYHRGAPPKRKHKGFRDLSPEDQKRVAPLASLLRLALALDRTHRQQVEEVRCQVVDDRVEITVRATGDAEVDLGRRGGKLTYSNGRSGSRSIWPRAARRLIRRRQSGSRWRSRKTLSVAPILPHRHGRPSRKPKLESLA